MKPCACQLLLQSSNQSKHFRLGLLPQLRRHLMQILVKLAIYLYIVPSYSLWPSGSRAWNYLHIHVLSFQLSGAGETLLQFLSLYNTMAQVDRGVRSCCNGTHIAAVSAVTLLLMFQSTRGPLLSIVLCIGVVFGIGYMAKGGSVGFQVFALLVIAVVVYLVYAAINTPYPEMHLGRAWEALLYLAVVGFLIVFFSVWCHSRQHVHIPYLPQVGTRQLQVGHAQ